MFERLVRFLASPVFALTCILSGAGLVGLALFPLQFFGIPGDQIAVLATRGVAFLAVYAALAVSLVACFMKRLRALPKLVGSAPRLLARDNELASPIPFDSYRAQEALARAGYRGSTVEDGRVFAVRSRFGPAGTYLLHGAILLGILTAALAQIPGTTFVGRARVAEDTLFEGTMQEFAETSEGRDLTGVDLPSFTVEDVEATSVDQRPATLLVTVRGAQGDARRITAGWPLFPDPFTMVAAEDFGVSARFSIAASGTVTPIATQAVDLTAHGSETTEYYEIHTKTRQRYRVGVKAAARPEQSDADEPLAVSLAEWRATTGGWELLGTSKSMTPGNILKAGSVWLQLEDTRPHAVLRVHRSTVAPLALLALVFAALGALLRLAFPRTEAVVEDRGDHTVIRVSSDVYRTAMDSRLRLVRAWEEGR